MSPSYVVSGSPKRCARNRRPDLIRNRPLELPGQLYSVSIARRRRRYDLPVIFAEMRSLTIALLLLPLAAPVLAQDRGFQPPRTPWGDPDLQGNFTNKYEQGTPFERPAQFEGRRMEDINGTELDTLVRERAVELLLNAPFTGGDPVAGNFGGAPAFYDRFEASKGSRPWFVVDPPDGKVPPMTPDGRLASAARAGARTARRRGRGPADSYTDRSLYDRCITRGLPGSMMPANYGNSYRIVQAPGHVAITYEMVHETRIIPVDQRPMLGAAIRQYMGEPRGHWDGNTLVVETTNFKDEPAYRGSNPRTLRLVERFTPTSTDTLEWSVTVDDPSTWSRPWTFAMPLTRNDKEAVFEYACHEGNMAMANMMSAARAEERNGGGRPERTAAARESVGSGRSERTGPTAEGNGLSGSWIAAPREAGAPGGQGNFAGFSTATRLTITESPVEVTVQANTGTENQMQTAVFKLDGSEHPAPGPVGWDTRARASREDGKLLVTITRTIDGPDGKLTFTIKDVYSESGGVLTLERTQGPRTVKTVYNRP
jgi:hypothetical protein